MVGSKMTENDREYSSKQSAPLMEADELLKGEVLLCKGWKGRVVEKIPC